MTTHAPAHPGPAGPHGHSHHHGPAAPGSKRLRMVIAAVLIPFTAAVLVGLVVLWPGGTPGHERSGVGFDRQTVQGKVTAVTHVGCKDATVPGGSGAGTRDAGAGAGGGDSGQSGGPGSAAPKKGSSGDGSSEGGSAEGGGSEGGGSESGGSGGGLPGGDGHANGVCEQATVEITEGKDRGHTYKELIQPDGPRRLHAGQGVVLAYAPDAPRELQYSVTDVRRTLPMVLLAGIFALAVVVVGRLRGVMALVALAVSFLVLTFFILPAVLEGSNPLVVAVVGASAIMLLALYLCHGLTARTSVAVLGTLVSLLLIGLLGSLFIGWASLTGNTDDNTGLIHGLYPHIDMSGLLLAGVIIGSLGVLDDVTVTQTSAVWELRQADPAISRRALYRAGIRIGRDHIASVVNTLVLAYAGASLPLLLLFSVAQSDVSTVAGSELVAEEIVRTLVGSIGLVASVPVTTALATLVVSADRPVPPEAGHGIASGPAVVPAPDRGPARGGAVLGGGGRRRKR